MARSRSLVNAGNALAAAALLGACSFFDAPPEPRGNLAEHDLVQQITPGVQTRADVQALLGSPSATGTFDENEWYYISGITRTRPMRAPGIESQRVVAIGFDRGGVVRTVRELGEQDAQTVSPVERITPVPGNDRTLLQALFGNIGRVGPGAGSPRGPGQ